MPNFADIIDRDDASALMPEDVQKEIVEGAIEESVAMTMFASDRMTRRQQRIPVLSVLPIAYFIDTQNDIGLKQTTTQAWSNKYLNAEEIAVLVPMPKNILSDSEYDVWGKIKPRVKEAIGLKFDNAVFFGVSKPATWPQDIVTAAIAAGNRVVEGTSSIDFADDINQAIAAVEEDGFEVNGFWGRVQMKSKLRGLRDGFQNLIFYPGSPGIAGAKMMPTSLWDAPIKFSKAGLSGFATGSGKAELIGGDFSQAVCAIREDIDMEVFTTGVIQDDTGAIIYNLMQQDMVCLRVTFRAAFQVPNPINRQEENEANRYPFAVVTQP